MARLREQGLRRSVGVSGMFATAYGNVGSSIYYALGLVAAHALGLTPLVFLFAGGLFALTAKTYAEGASMFPEAGGASSFALHAIGYPPGNIIAALVALAILVILNIRGLGESAKVNFFLAVTDLGTQVL